MTNLALRVRAIPSWQVTLGLALLALGFLIAAQLASEGPRVRYTTQERSPLIDTAMTLQTQQQALKDEILQLRDRIQSLELQGQGSEQQIRDLNDQLAQARLAAGLTALTGTGIVFRLEDSTQPTAQGASDADYLVNAQDVRTVVEELWLAGAEAIAVNGERVTATTAIIDIGGSVFVNSAYLSAPFQISAIGPKDLYQRVSAREGFVDFIVARAQAFGIGVKWLESDDVEIPAFAGTVTLRQARIATPSGSPGGGSPSTAPTASGPVPSVGD